MKLQSTNGNAKDAQAVQMQPNIQSFNKEIIMNTVTQEQTEQTYYQLQLLRSDPYFTFDLEDYYDHYQYNADAETARFRYTAEGIAIHEAMEEDPYLERWNAIIDEIFD